MNVWPEILLLALSMGLCLAGVWHCYHADRAREKAEAARNQAIDAALLAADARDRAADYLAACKVHAAAAEEFARRAQRGPDRL